MRAIVLVGGEGTRLRPLTFSEPKQMLPIVEQPMIERVVAALVLHGVTDVILSLGYLPKAFLDSYPDGLIGGATISYAVEPEPFDTAGAIAFAADQAGVEDTFVVVNGDVLTDMDLSGLIDFHRSSGAEGSIGLHPVADPSAFGVVPTDDDGRVVAFVEKPPRDQAPTNEINAGTYVLEPTFLDRVPRGRRVSIEREVFPAMAADRRLFARSDDAYWLDTGTPADFLQANRELLAGRRGHPPVPGAVLADGSVWTLGDAEIQGIMAGNCVVGTHASIAGGASVTASVIGAGCVVEQGATVVDSVLMAGARVASGSSVHSSILGKSSTVGERCTLRVITVLGANAIVSSGSELDNERVPA